MLMFVYNVNKCVTERVQTKPFILKGVGICACALATATGCTAVGCGGLTWAGSSDFKINLRKFIMFCFCELIV